VGVSARPATWAAPWTPAEDDTVRALYEKRGADACSRALPGRTRAAIMHRAARLGVKTHRRWTPVDDARLRQFWGCGFRVETVAKRLGRTPATTYWRWTAAAERTGYATTQLWRICRWAGVEVHRAMSRPNKPRGKGRRHAFRHHFVDGFELDEAIERWHRTEVVESAARARGLIGGTLKRWLVEAGLTPPSSKRRWRVESETIDRVVTHRVAFFHKKKRPAVAQQEDMFA
jgi:hypothetical protein